ncbi:fasciclin domain-containing protein [Demequina activiva]|uniref:Cell surface glycolipoprotein MPT83 n=1 Tax=Demequina activiva TaxID=1582364 RepID=A0A919Q0R6_9MICO|nr:fasciclin domain-containing protein [Demequina activiva]GIG53899.1 cell surface glycolipoprotein MPT83 [Demequina activiva]
MLTKKTKFSTGLALAVAGTFALSACSASDGDMEDPAMSDTPEMTEEADPAMTEDAMEEDAMEMDAYANLVGPACMDYDAAVPDGAGSIQGMSQDPVAVAASNNPMLTTLVSAVSGELNPSVNLVDTLNGDEFTVFAPVDDAFAKIDENTIATLQDDADLLSSILTYHVVPGQVEPAEIAGTWTTVNGADLEVTGSGDDLTVNGESMVLCGGVQTANATVYLIDTVLMPPAAE